MKKTIVFFIYLGSVWLQMQTPAFSQDEFAPISAYEFQPIISDATSSAALSPEDIVSIKTFLATPSELAAMEPNDGGFDGFAEEGRISQGQDSIRNMLEDISAQTRDEIGDHVYKTRTAIFGHQISRLHRVEVLNAGPIYVQLADEGSDEAILVDDIYRNADKIARNLAAGLREARIYERIEKDLREGLLSDRYTVADLVAFKEASPHSPALLLFYERLDESLLREDARWLKSVEDGLADSIRGRILLAVARSSDEKFEYLIDDALSNYPNSAYVKLLTRD